MLDPRRKDAVLEFYAAKIFRKVGWYGALYGMGVIGFILASSLRSITG